MLHSDAYCPLCEPGVFSDARNKPVSIAIECIAVVLETFPFAERLFGQTFISFAVANLLRRPTIAAFIDFFYSHALLYVAAK